jgi:hypothetical protein
MLAVMAWHRRQEGIELLTIKSKDYDYHFIQRLAVVG